METHKTGEKKTTTKTIQDLKGRESMQLLANVGTLITPSPSNQTISVSVECIKENEKTSAFKNNYQPVHNLCTKHFSMPAMLNVFQQHQQQQKH